MKSLIIPCLLALFTLGACDYEQYHYQGEVDPIIATVADLATVETAHIDVPQGQVAVVTLKETGDTIAELPMSCDIMVPTMTEEAVTRANFNSYDVNYISAVGGSFNSKQQFIYDSYFTVAFEDSKELDCDYNDLVLNICLDNRAPRSTDNAKDFKARLFVHPIALGGTKQVGFGIRLQDGTEKLLTDDVRRDYFQGKLGFINTELTQTEPMQFPVVEAYTQDEFLGSIYFFIQADGERRYALNTGNTDRVVDTHGYPYGIIVTNCNGNDTNVGNKLTAEDKNAFKDHQSNASNYLFKTRTWWQYPAEQVSLDEAYTHKPGAPKGTTPYKGTFDWVMRTGGNLKEVCYYNRAQQGKVFPCIVYRADGTVDSQRTVYFTKFIEQ